MKHKKNAQRILAALIAMVMALSTFHVTPVYADTAQSHEPVFESPASNLPEVSSATNAAGFEIRPRSADITVGDTHQFAVYQLTSQALSAALTQSEFVTVIENTFANVSVAEGATDITLIDIDTAVSDALPNFTDVELVRYEIFRDGTPVAGGYFNGGNINFTLDEVLPTHAGDYTVVIHYNVTEPLPGGWFIFPSADGIVRATISDSGLLTALAPGRVEIAYTADGQTARAIALLFLPREGVIADSFLAQHGGTERTVNFEARNGGLSPFTLLHREFAGWTSAYPHNQNSGTHAVEGSTIGALFDFPGEPSTYYNTPSGQHSGISGPLHPGWDADTHTGTDPATGAQRHLQSHWDSFLQRYVMGVHVFGNHICPDTGVVISCRYGCYRHGPADRQRIELRTTSQHLYGRRNELSATRYMMMIPSYTNIGQNVHGFFHVFQYKGVVNTSGDVHVPHGHGGTINLGGGGGEGGNPILSLTVTATHLQFRHAWQGRVAGMNTLAQVPLHVIEDRWVDIEIQILNAQAGWVTFYMRCVETGEILMYYDSPDEILDMWRHAEINNTNAAFGIVAETPVDLPNQVNRFKWGLYRSASSTNIAVNDVTVYFADMTVWRPGTEGSAAPASRPAPIARPVNIAERSWHTWYAGQIRPQAFDVTDTQGVAGHEFQTFNNVPNRVLDGIICPFLLEHTEVMGLTGGNPHFGHFTWMSPAGGSVANPWAAASGSLVVDLGEYLYFSTVRTYTKTRMLQSAIVSIPIPTLRGMELSDAQRRDVSNWVEIGRMDRVPENIRNRDLITTIGLNGEFNERYIRVDFIGGEVGENGFNTTGFPFRAENILRVSAIQVFSLPPTPELVNVDYDPATNTATITWTPVPGVYGFAIYDGPFAIVTDIPADVTYYVITGLLPGSRYQLGVSTIGRCRYSFVRRASYPRLDENYFITDGDFLPPRPPESVIVSPVYEAVADVEGGAGAAARIPRSLMAEWTPVHGASEYRVVLVAPGEGGYRETLGYTRGNTWQVDWLSSDTEYTIAVYTNQRLEWSVEYGYGSYRTMPRELSRNETNLLYNRRGHVSHTWGNDFDRWGAHNLFDNLLPFTTPEGASLIGATSAPSLANWPNRPAHPASNNWDASRWAGAAGQTEGWILVDIGEITQVRYVEVYSHQFYRLRDFSIYYSADPAAWLNQDRSSAGPWNLAANYLNVVNVGRGGAFVTLDSAVTARYLLIQINDWSPGSINMCAVAAYTHMPPHWPEPIVYGIQLNPATNHTFTEANLGYAAVTPHSVTVTNIGLEPTGNLTVALTGSHHDSFVLNNDGGTQITINSLAPGASATFTVAPVLGLGVAAHQATVTVANVANEISESFNLTFIVGDAQINFDSWQLVRRFTSTNPLLAANRNLDFSIAYINHGPVLGADDRPIPGIDGYIAFAMGMAANDPLYNRVTVGTLRDRFRIGLNLDDGEFLFDNDENNITFIVRDRDGNTVTNPLSRIESGYTITVEYHHCDDPLTFLAAMNVTTSIGWPNTMHDAWVSGGTVTGNADIWAGISLPNVQTGTGGTGITITQPAAGSALDWNLPAGLYRMDFVSRLDNSMTAILSRPEIRIAVNGTNIIEDFDTNFGVYHRASNVPGAEHRDTFSGPGGLTGRWLNPRYELVVSPIQLNPTFRFPLAHIPGVFELNSGGNVFEFMRMPSPAGTRGNLQVASMTLIPLPPAPAANYELTLTGPGGDLAIGGTHTFAPLAPGYNASELVPLEITVTNTGNRETGAITVSLSGDSATSFQLSQTTTGIIGLDNTGSITLPSLGLDDTAGFTVAPASGLSAGVHTAAVTISNGADIDVSFYVSFAVVDWTMGNWMMDFGGPGAYKASHNIGQVPRLFTDTLAPAGDHRWNANTQSLRNGVYHAWVAVDLGEARPVSEFWFAFDGGNARERAGNITFAFSNDPADWAALNGAGMAGTTTAFPLGQDLRPSAGLPFAGNWQTFFMGTATAAAGTRTGLMAGNNTTTGSASFINGAPIVGRYFIFVIDQTAGLGAFDTAGQNQQILAWHLRNAPIPMTAIHLTQLPAPIIEMDDETGMIYWESVEDADGYQIYVNEDAHPFGFIADSDIVSFDLALLGLEPGIYHVALRAVSHDSFMVDSPLSNFVLFIVEEYPIGDNAPEDMPAYEGDDEYDAKPEYDEEADYDAKPEYDEEADYDAEPDYNEEADYDAEPDYDEEADCDAEPEYDEEPRYDDELENQIPVSIGFSSRGIGATAVAATSHITREVSAVQALIPRSPGTITSARTLTLGPITLTVTSATEPTPPPTATPTAPPPPVGGGGGGGAPRPVTTPTPTPDPTTTPAPDDVDVPVRRITATNAETGETIAIDYSDIELPEDFVADMLLRDELNEMFLHEGMQVLTSANITSLIRIYVGDLNLSDEQLIMLVGFEFDPETGYYNVIRGVFSANRSYFYFEFEGAGIVGVMLYERPMPLLRFTIGEAGYYHNGVPTTSDVAPFISGNRTMVPLRVISEALGATPRWDNATRTAYIYNGDVVLRLPMGQPLPDGMGVPEMRNNRVLVPARFVIENFDAITLWNATLQEVTVYVW